MQVFNSSERYGAVVRSLHWTAVALILLAWLLGLFGDDLPKGPARDLGLFIHITAGLVVLAMVVLRILWRIVDRAPDAESGRYAVLMQRMASLAHIALYGLMIAVPVVGIVVQFARGQPLPLFGITEIASPWPADRAFARSVKEVHELLAHALVAIAAVHAAAALFHHWVLRDNTLRRMWPGRLSSP